MTRPQGLRQRLTLSYVILFALLFAGVGWLFRQTLISILRRDAAAILEEDFAAAKVYLQIENGVPRWIYPLDDPDHSRVVQGLQQVLLVADANLKVLQSSSEFDELHLNLAELRATTLSARKPQDRFVRSPSQRPYLLRFGLHHTNFLLCIGRPLDADERIVSQFTKAYLIGLPIALIGVLALGWFLAAHGLEPLNTVAQAAQTVTGSKLDVKLARRGANDELDHLIDAFNGMVDRLNSSFTQMRQFTANASHELRTPLTAIRGQLEVALLTAETCEQYRESIMTAIEDVDHLSAVVRALLQLSQAESGQLAIKREPVDLGALVEKVIEQFHLPADPHGIHLVCQARPRAHIEGDPVQLQRLVSNLISNALGFTPGGGTVTVSVAPAPNAVDLTVADTGCGIAPEHLPHIFERFYRAPESTRTGERGLGLGLSFVSWIARQHNANIQVDSKLGQGTCVTITFAPLARTSDHATPGRLLD